MNNCKGNKYQTDHRRKLAAKLTYDLPVLRVRMGASQEEMAEKIGISRQTYNSIEKGRTEMSWMVFMALVAVFQNNEETHKMLLNIEGIEEELKNISSTQKSIP